MMKAVIFDLDGTLLETLGDLHESVNAALGYYDYPLRTRQEVHDFIGNGIWKLMERSLPKGSSQEEVEKLYDWFCSYYQEHCHEKTLPYPGIVELLTQLHKRGIKTGVVTNKVQQAAEELMEFYFPGLLDVVSGVPKGGKTKPDPEGLLAAMDSLGCTKDQCLYVGDSEVDIETAQRAGVKEAAVLWGFKTREFLAIHGAKIFISYPGEILNWIEANK